MYSNIRLARSHKAVEMFFKFFHFLFPGDTDGLLRSFLAMTANLKLTNINGAKNKAMTISKFTEIDITKPFLEIIYKTATGMSTIPRRVSSLRLVTDVR